METFTVREGEFVFSVCACTLQNRRPLVDMMAKGHFTHYGKQTSVLKDVFIGQGVPTNGWLLVTLLVTLAHSFFKGPFCPSRIAFLGWTHLASEGGRCIFWKIRERNEYFWKMKCMPTRSWLFAKASVTSLKYEGSGWGGVGAPPFSQEEGEGKGQPSLSLRSSCRSLASLPCARKNWLLSSQGENHSGLCHQLVKLRFIRSMCLMLRCLLVLFLKP